MKGKKLIFAFVLALIVCLVLVPCAYAEDEGDEGENTTPVVTIGTSDNKPVANSEVTVSATAGSEETVSKETIQSSSIQSVIDAATGENTNVSVTTAGGDTETQTVAGVKDENNAVVVNVVADTTESIVITSGQTVTLNINEGVTLTNTDGKDTITVALGGTLYITGSGTIDNVSNGRAAILNNGTVYLNGVTLTRSKEDGGSNTYYTVLNHGKMEMTDVNISNKAGFSSMIANGYYSYNDTNDRLGYVKGTGQANPSLIINSGNYSGGINTVKNDDNATLVINGGTFSNVTQATVQNHNVATLNGGSYDCTGSSTCYAVLICGCASSLDVGKTAINGGTYVSSGANIYFDPSDKFKDLKITSGIFSDETFRSYVAEGIAVEEIDGKWYVGASIPAPVVEEVEAVVEQIVDTVEEAVSTTVEAVIEGNSTVSLAANEEVVIKLNFTANDASGESVEVLSVTVNGVELEFTVAEDGSIVLSPEALAALGPGTHVIYIRTSEGLVKVTITITE